jgi:hypothetical protein
MTLLGTNLSQHMRFMKGKLSLKTVLQLGDQMVRYKVAA